MSRSRSANRLRKSLAVISTATILAAIVIVAAIAATILTFDGPTLASADAAGQRTHVVEIHKFKFAPKALAVRPGDVIVWINKDIVPHSATADDGSWDTGLIDAGARVRTTVPSDFFKSYHCKYHRSMTALLEAPES